MLILYVGFLVWGSEVYRLYPELSVSAVLHAAFIASEDPGGNYILTAVFVMSPHF